MGAGGRLEYDLVHVLDILEIHDMSRDQSSPKKLDKQLINRQ
jgi:hypothetical protein